MSHPRNIFDKWMKFGGIDSGPRMFSGRLDPGFLENNSTSDIASMSATTFVGEDKTSSDFDQNWTIDFEAVAKSFLCVSAQRVVLTKY